jgi:TDG/mug DNA glycosylase family protein
LMRYRPLIVCFVGKKIWDVYESVIAKKASAMTPPRSNETGIKLDPEERVTTPIKTEPGSEDVSTERNVTPFTPTISAEVRSTPSRKSKAKVKFDWTQPRSFRLPHTSEGETTRYTYFWVVPNTSGLERTPVRLSIHLSPRVAGSIADVNESWRNRLFCLDI